MTAILKKWLSMRLDVSFKWNPEDFGKAVCDGVIISQLLQSYNVISPEQKDSIVCSNDSTEIRNNLLVIKEWLKEINIELNLDDVDYIADGIGSVGLRLFYQMFLELDGKDRLYFIRKKVTESLSDGELNLYPHSVTPVESSNPVQLMVAKANNFKFAKDILEKRKSNESPQSDQINTKPSASKESLKRPCQAFNYTYNELKKLEEKAKQNMKGGQLIDKERVKEYKNKIKNAGKKGKKVSGFEANLENDILEKMLQQYESKEKEKKQVKCLLDLSIQEKKMAEQLIKANHEMTLVMKNRIKQQEELGKLRQLEFSKALDDLKYQIKQKAKQLDFEKQILSLFNEKLHSEEMAQNFCETLKLCKGTLSALLNLVYKLSEFKQMTSDKNIPEIYMHEWKTMFFIGDNMDPTEPEDIEQATQEERSILDEEEFLSYHNKTGSWTVDVPCEGYSQCEHIESQGYRILGCILEKFFAAKYPIPKYANPDPLPTKRFATILLNAKDLLKNSTFLDLLSERNTLVIQMSQAIAFCLEEYKRELIEFDEMSTEFSQFEISLKNSASEEHQINNSIESESTIQIVDLANKHTQTPTKLPLVDKYSIAAQLGKVAYECLNSGNCISDELLASIIVEFLRNNLSFDGWVLIDYPKTFLQAKFLEEKITGQIINLKQEYKENNETRSIIEPNVTRMSSISATTSKSEINNRFQSRIIPKPDDNGKIISEFETFFTAFLKLKQSICISNEDCIWKLTEENSTLIERFYADQGINYSIYFERFDETTVKFIVEYVTGETETFEKFSKSFSLTNMESSSEEISKFKLMKNETVKSDASISVNQNISKESEESQVISTESASNELPGEFQSEAFTTDMNSQTSTLQESKSVCCIDLPLPLNILIDLASLWETNELVYIENMKELFFGRRKIFSELIPYVSYVRKYLTYPVQVDPIVGNIIIALQTELNLIEDAMRGNAVVKSEMYYKMNEMQTELNAFVENIKKEHTERTMKLIEEDWLTRNLTSLTNYFVMMIQTELNRAQETVKIISAYYNAYFGNNANQEELNVFSLLKISTSASSSHIQEEPDVDVEISESNLYSSCVQNALKNFTELSNDDNPFHQFLDSTKASVEIYIGNLLYFHETLIGQASKDTTTKKGDPKAKSDPKGKSDSKAKSDPKAKNDPKLKTNSKDKPSDESKTISTPEITVSDVVEEWKTILNAEICRFRNRMNVIHFKAMEQLSQCKGFVFKAFVEANRDAEGNFNRDINKITLICNLLKTAVEKEWKLPSRLIFDSEEFEKHIEISWNLIMEKDAIKFAKTCDFPIGQLAKFQSRLMSVAKNCSMPMKAFVIMLQDFFILNMNNQCMRPTSTYDWNLLEPDDYSIIVRCVYGDVSYVDWRDFLILCVDIGFPDQLQLLALRNAFMAFDFDHNETIRRDDYYNVCLWFQPPEGCDNSRYVLRACLIKELLFLLFEVSVDVLNYSAFLLAFCKMENPEEGFVNALSLVLGKVVSRDFARCESFAQSWLQEMNIKNALHQDAIRHVDSLMSSIVDHTIRICSDVNISDIITPKTSLECFNKAFLRDKLNNKAIPDGKPVKTSRSAVIAESTRNSLSNSIRSKSRKSKNVTIDLSVVGTAIEEREKALPTPEEVYLVSEETVKRVLLASLPWNCRMEFAEPYADIVYGLSQTFTELKYDTNCDCVFIHKLLRHQFIKTLLSTIHKFKLTNPCYISTEIILDRENAF